MSGRCGMLERLPVRTLDGADSLGGAAAAGRIVYTDALGVETTKENLTYVDTVGSNAVRLWNTSGVDTTNYERLAIKWDSNVALIQTEQGGTGTARNLKIGTVGSAHLYFRSTNVDRWLVEATSGALLANINNTYDIGDAAGTNRPRSIYWGTQALGADGAVGAPSWSFASATTTGAYLTAGSIALTIGGAAKAAITATGLASGVIGTSYNFFATSANGGNIGIAATAPIGWTSGSDASIALDTYFARSAAGAVYLTQPTVGATNCLLRINNDSTNASALAAVQFVTDSATSTVWQVFARNDELFIGRATVADYWKWSTAGHMLAGTDNTYDIGASGATRPRNLYWATQALGPAGSAAVPTVAYDAETTTGIYFSTANVRFTLAGTNTARFATGGLVLATDASSTIFFGDSLDVRLTRDAAAILAQKNADVAQTFRVYGAATGTKYASFSHNATDVIIANSFATGDIRLLASAAQGFIFDCEAYTINTTANTTISITGQTNGFVVTKAAHATNGRTLLVTNAADSALTASTEYIDVDFDLDASKTWAAGAVALNRQFLIRAGTFNTATFDDVVTFAVSGPPSATATRSWTATFGALEAPVTAIGTLGFVGIFAAGFTGLVCRNTSNNVEGVITCGTGQVFIGSATNHAFSMKVNDTTIWNYTTSGHLEPATNNTYNVGSGSLAVKDFHGYTLSLYGTGTVLTFGGTAAAAVIVTDTTQGLKIGGATTQKISLWNATPIVQPAGIADADGTLADITTKFNSLLGKLESFGFLAVA